MNPLSAGIAVVAVVLAVLAAVLYGSRSPQQAGVVLTQSVAQATSTPTSETPEPAPEVSAVTVRLETAPRQESAPAAAGSAPDEVPPVPLSATEPVATPAAPSGGAEAPAPTSVFSIDSFERGAIVSLLCIDTSDSPITGTGIVVDPRGIILTNAHVAVEFLFSGWPDEPLRNCSVRKGSPARVAYRAEIMFIPEGYVRTAVDYIGKDDEGYVYGTDDYALLRVSAPSDESATLPSSFPFARVNPRPSLSVGSPTYMIGYPASFISWITIYRDHHMVNSMVPVKEIKSLPGGSPGDVFAFSGSIAGQYGTSGGAVIQSDYTVVAIPTFFDDGGQGTTTNSNVLNAISVQYIDRRIRGETGMSLAAFIGQKNPEAVSAEFMETKMPQYRLLFARKWKEVYGVTLRGVQY